MGIMEAGICLKWNTAKKLNILKNSLIMKYLTKLFLNIAEGKEIHSTKKPFSRIIIYLMVSSGP